MTLKNLFYHVEGLPLPKEHEFVNLDTNQTTLFLKHMKFGILGKKVVQTFEIPLSRILEIGIVSEIYEKRKSSIGRAIVGGVVLGPLGAIIGSVSGVGTKDAKRKTFTIIYLASDDTIKTILLKMASAPGANNFSYDKKIQKIVALVPKDSKVKELLQKEEAVYETSMNEDGTITTKL